MKKIYIGDGFGVNLYWSLPIIASYAKYNDIKIIILDSKIEPILREGYLKKLYENFDLEYLETKNNKYQKIFFLLYSFFKNFFKYLLIFFNLKKIMFSKNWLNSQLAHSIWDTSSLYHSDNLKSNSKKNLKPGFLAKIKALIVCAGYYEKSKILVKKKIHSAFLSHTVYQHRTILASLREKNIKVYTQAMFNIFRQPKNFDTNWNMQGNIKLLKHLSTKISICKSEKYWVKKSMGKGRYLDSNVALGKNKEIDDKKINIVFLHIMRDSSFNVIDRNRIFTDYIDWLEVTLKHVSESNERWYFKEHPSSADWGENTRKIFDDIFKNSLKKKSKKNIFFIDNTFSNIEIFKKAKRIITYRGTAHLEAATYGIKPIIISSSYLHELDNSFAYKPRNQNEYRELLLYEKVNFKISKSQIKKAKKLLYVYDNILTIKHRLSVKRFYRKTKTTKTELSLLAKKSMSNLKFLKLCGKKLYDGYSHLQSNFI